MEPDKFFSQVNTFRACLSRTSLACSSCNICLWRDMIARFPRGRLGRRYSKSVAEAGGRKTGNPREKEGESRPTGPRAGFERGPPPPSGGDELVSHPPSTHTYPQPLA